VPFAGSDRSRFRNAVLLLLVTAISVAFVAMIRGFLVTILVAAIFAGPSFLFTLGGLMPLRREGVHAMGATRLYSLALTIYLAAALVGWAVLVPGWMSGATFGAIVAVGFGLGGVLL